MADGPARVEVWWARDDHPSADPDRLRGALPATVLRRLDRLPPAAARRSGLAAVLLRAAAGTRLGLPAADVEVVRRCPCGRPDHGRPTLPGSGLHASVSHTRGLVGVATARHPVGLDVEADRVVDVAAVAPLLSRDPLRTRADVLITWTRKESVLKATGEGLRRPLRDVLVSAPGAPARLLGHPGLAGNTGAMADLRPVPGVRAAMTVLGIGAVVVSEQWADRLLGPC